MKGYPLLTCIVMVATAFICEAIFGISGTLMIAIMALYYSLAFGTMGDNP